VQLSWRRLEKKRFQAAKHVATGERRNIGKKKERKKSFQTSIATFARDTAYTTSTYASAPSPPIPNTYSFWSKLTETRSKSFCARISAISFLSLLITLNLRDTIISKAVHIHYTRARALRLSRNYKISELTRLVNDWFRLCSIILIYSRKNTR